MINGAFPLLERSLRVDARSLAIHLIHLGQVVGIYLVLLVITVSGATTGAPGLTFLSGMAGLDICFITLLGVGLFSTSITQEKEEDTLGLMLMAGISPFGLLVGKTLGPLWQALLLLAIQLPFMLLAITLGGVTMSQVTAMTVSLAAYLILIAGLGLLCSILAPRSRLATTCTVVALVLYYFGCGTAQELYSQRGLAAEEAAGQSWASDLAWAIVGGIGRSSVLSRIGEIFQSDFSGSPFDVQVFSNAIAGMILGLLAWSLFGVATRHPTTEATTRGWDSWRRKLFGVRGNRAWSNPFVWKDFQFSSGGLTSMAIRTAYYLGIAGFAWLSSTSPNSYMDWAEAFFPWVIFSLPIDVALLVGRSMNGEIRGQTLSSLIMLPHSTKRIVYSKLAGAMIVWLPGPIIAIAVLCWTDVGPDLLHGVMEQPWTLSVLPMILLLLSLPAHFAAVLALYLRWGAVAVALGMTIAFYTILMTFTGCLVPWFMMGAPNGWMIIVFVYTILLAGVCFACHAAMLLRIDYLASK